MSLQERFGNLGIRPRGRRRGNVRDSFQLPERISSFVDGDGTIYSSRKKRNRGIRVKESINNLFSISKILFKIIGRSSIRIGPHKMILNPVQLLFSFLCLYLFIIRTETSTSTVYMVRADHFFQGSILIVPFVSQSRHFQLYQNDFYLSNDDDDDDATLKPDYGDLLLTFIDDTDQTFTRQIKPDPDLFHGHVWSADEYESHQFDDAYYALDDDHVRSTSFTDINLKCRRTAFHRMYHPNCNMFHEFVLKEGKYLG